MSDKVILNEGSEEFKAIKEQWLKQARECKVDSLQSFITELTDNYQHDYGTICHAMAIAAQAAVWAMNNTDQGGITGFQAGAVMWQFVREWNHSSNKTGLRLIDYDNFLYPQYERDFQKVMSADTWKSIRKVAKENIRELSSVDSKVYKHWQKIAEGIIPFGYTVKSS